MFGGNSLHYLIAEVHLASVLLYSCPKHFVQYWRRVPRPRAGLSPPKRSTGEEFRDREQD